MGNIKVLQTRAKNQYDLVIYQRGYEKCSSDQVFGPFRRDCFLLHFIISGKGIYKVRGREFELKKGDCFLVIPDEDTYYEANKDDPYEFYWVGFRGVNSKQFMEKCGFYTDDNFVYHCNEEEYEEVHRYMKIIVNVDIDNARKSIEGGEVDEKGYIKMLGYLYVLLSVFMKNSDILAERMRIDENTWNEVEEYISFNYWSNITVGSLAARFRFHRTSIYKLFKRNTGLSPSAYILNFRLEKALIMVKTTNKLFQSIALECGFNDSTYFYKAFKRKYKRTPREVRELG